MEKRDLERVHSPIGIPIGAETPEEIAVSIMAELIKSTFNFNGTELIAIISVLFRICDLVIQEQSISTILNRVIYIFFP